MRFSTRAVPLRSIMWIPLVVKQKLIGGLGIGHEEPGKYTERDAGLVQAIASQAAVALENARLYEQAHELAVMHERQRLARELHDSVTQSLYSLSLMAEAARRLVAAGNKDRGMGYLVRIGESAQQVLKEMRLLVYELRPLMLERDGLASALKQRLETVEGRAGRRDQAGGRRRRAAARAHRDRAVPNRTGGAEQLAEALERFFGRRLICRRRATRFH